MTAIEHLKSVMEKRGLCPLDLAVGMKIDVKVVKKILDGQSKITESFAKKCELFLRVDADELMTMQREETEQKKAKTTRKRRSYVACGKCGKRVYCDTGVVEDGQIHSVLRLQCQHCDHKFAQMVMFSEMFEQGEHDMYKERDR